MSVNTRIVVECDSVTCIAASGVSDAKPSERSTFSDDDATSKRGARAIARANGWLIAGGLDICPACVSAMKGEVVPAAK